MSDAAGSGDERRIGILTTDVDLIIRSWDAGLQRMTGIASAGAIGRRIHDIIPDLASRVPEALLREPLLSGTVQVLAPALHKFLIPCPPLEPSVEFDRMQQRVVVGALRDEQRAVGLVVTIEDVTARLERERRLARQLTQGAPADRMLVIRQLANIEPTDGLGPIQSALADEDWQVRRSAVRALSARRDKALVDAVVLALRDGHRDFSLLSSALQLLTLTGVDVTDALVGLMQDPNADLRIQVALALGTQRRPEAIDALIAALDDPDANVRFHAIEALGQLAHPGAIDRLAEIMESGDFFLAFPALEALARINDPLVAPRLVARLSDEMLGGAAADALGQLADEDAVIPLARALDAPTASVESIIGAIAHIHHRYQSQFSGGNEIEDLARQNLTATGIARILGALDSASGVALKQLVVVLSWLRDDKVPRALARLLGSADVRHEVVEAFVRFGPSGTPLLINQLTIDDPDTKRAAIVALGRIGDRRATLALAAVLEDEDSRELWVSAAGALARIGDGRAFDVLCSRLGDANAGVRQAVTGALNSIGHPDMESRIRVLLDDPRPEAREAAVRIAGYFGYSQCVDAVFALCDDADETVRAAALEHLPYFDDPRAIGALAHAIVHDSPRARAAAAQALGSIQTPQSAALLARAVDDDDAWVSYFTVIALGRQAIASALPALDRIARTDAATHVAAAAIEAVGAIGGDDAIAILAPLTADAGDRGHAAVRTVGRVASARSVDILRDSLRSSDPRRRVIAVDALAGQDDEGVVDILQWTANADADRTVTGAALAALGALANRSVTRGRAAVQALVGCLGDPARREDALGLLARLGPSAVPWLADLLDNENPRVRHSVVDALSRLSHPSASAGLQHALSDEDASVRRAAIAALARLGTRGLSRRMASLAEQDPSQEVRRAAAAALRQRGYEGRE